LAISGGSDFLSAMSRALSSKKLGENIFHAGEIYTVLSESRSESCQLADADEGCDGVAFCGERYELMLL
jgi:hypothetical protein